MSLRVDYDERAISQAAAFLDDPHGIREVLDAIDRLADEPRPAGSFPYGSPDLRRLRVGRYRVTYEIKGDVEQRCSTAVPCGTGAQPVAAPSRPGRGGWL